MMLTYLNIMIFILFPSLEKKIVLKFSRDSFLTWFPLLNMCRDFSVSQIGKTRICRTFLLISCLEYIFLSTFPSFICLDCVTREYQFSFDNICWVDTISFPLCGTRPWIFFFFCITKKNKNIYSMI